MTSLLVRAIYYFAGLNALPYHVFLLVLLGANMALTYAVARRLTGSREAAGVTVLLFTYHHRFDYIYFDTGFLSDPICYFFYFCALLLYVHVRQARPLRIWELAACSALEVCALNSKEMGVALPLILLSYELVYHPPLAWRPGALTRWMLHEGRAAILTALITVAFVAGRATGADSLVNNAMYRPVVTWAQFMATSGHFFGDVFGDRTDWSAPAVVLLWALMAAVAWVARDKALRFAWLFTFFAPLPIAFIHPRGAAQYYVAWFGWVLYAAVALVKAVAWMTRKLWSDSPRVERWRAPVLTTGLALILYPYFQHQGYADLSSALVEAPVNRSVVTQLSAMHRRLHHGSRLLFLNDPIPTDWENMIFLVQLTYRDRTLEVERAKRMPQPPDRQKQAEYDHVFDYRDGRFIDLTPPPAWRPAQAPAIKAIFHVDFSPVTPQAPARPGEKLIVQATDLGPTRPPRAPDQPFPADPLLPVAADIGAEIDGRSADVSLQIGWPEMINTYRVDVTVPKRTRSGEATIKLEADDIAGQPAKVPVR